MSVSAILLVVAVMLAGVAAAEAPPRPPHKHISSSIVEKCKIEFGPRTYDLCPLFKHATEWTIAVDVPTPPTETRMEYKLGFGGPLSHNGTLPADEQCEEGTWVCMTTTNRRPAHRSEPPRITQLIPVVSAASAPNATTTEKFGTHVLEARPRDQKNTDSKITPPILQLIMTGGHYVGRAQRALINFRCPLTEPAPPPALTYAWSWNGTHAFDWRTRHACAHQQAQPAPSPPESDGGDGEAPPDIDAPPEQDDLLPPVNSRVSLGTLAAAFLCSAVALSAIGYAAAHPPAFARRRLAPYARKVGRAARRLRKWRGRPGEVKLVRWAEEDLPIFGLGDDDDVDEGEMVNAREAVYDDDDEQIPLKPSPKLGYGAVAH